MNAECGLPRHDVLGAGLARCRSEKPDDLGATAGTVRLVVFTTTERCGLAGDVPCAPGRKANGSEFARIPGCSLSL